MIQSRLRDILMIKRERERERKPGGEVDARGILKDNKNWALRDGI
jgi:hypothetical protein